LVESVAMAEDQLIIDALLQYRERRNSFGLVSLSEDPLQLLMWARYGEEHRGAAVEIDLTGPRRKLRETKEDHDAGSFPRL
jgi:hypothetical protein